jgi:hypothetical protein
MTRTRKAGLDAMFSVEYACDRRCQVEFDLSDVHIRFTLGQMLASVEMAHDKAHTKEQKVYRTNDLLVRAVKLPPATQAITQAVTQ